MITFKEHFNIPITQPVDFLEIPIDQDLEAFICPILIANNRQDRIANDVYLQLQKFLENLNRSFIVPNDRKNGLFFLSKLHEPNEYYLGYSGTNKGKAIAEPRAEIIFNALSNNKFARQGISVTNEAHNVLLLVKGIGQDIMSDTIANVCRNIFAEFTVQQCLKYSIPTTPVQINYFNTLTNLWNSAYFDLPSYRGKPIILIPQNISSGGRNYSNNYNYFVSGNYISADILSGKIVVDDEGKFIAKLKDGTKKAIVKMVYKVYGKQKEHLVDFVLKYQDSLERFLEYAKEHYPALNLSSIK